MLFRALTYIVVHCLQAIEPMNSQENIVERSMLTGFVIGAERRARDSAEEECDERFVIDACEYSNMRGFLVSLIENSLAR